MSGVFSLKPARQPVELFATAELCEHAYFRISGTSCSKDMNPRHLGFECDKRLRTRIEICALEIKHGCTRLRIDTMCASSSQPQQSDCSSYLLRQCILFGQNGSFPPAFVTDEPIKIELRPEASNTHMFLKTIPFWRIAPVQPNLSDITVSTHGSISKLDQILRLVKAWPGPVSVSLYTQRWERDEAILVNFYQKHRQTFHSTDFHVIQAIVPDTTFDSKDKKDDTNAYPFNYMRNLAFQGSRTDYILALDADFMPNPTAYEELTTIPRSAYDKKTVLVVPAFQRSFEPNQVIERIVLPPSKEELIQAIRREHSIRPFHLPEYQKGHGPTDYEKWYLATSRYVVKYKYKYEPYIVVFRENVPVFWNGFRGFGWNKQSWLFELDAAGYRFEVVPNSFLIHIDHESDQARKTRVSHNQLQVAAFKSYVKSTY